MRVEVILRRECRGKVVYLLLDGALLPLSEVRLLPREWRLRVLVHMEGRKGIIAGNVVGWRR